MRINVLRLKKMNFDCTYNVDCVVEDPGYIYSIYTKAYHRNNIKSGVVLLKVLLSFQRGDLSTTPFVIFIPERHCDLLRSKQYSRNEEQRR